MKELAKEHFPVFDFPVSIFPPPMLDIKLIRERPDFVRRQLASRGAGAETGEI